MKVQRVNRPKTQRGKRFLEGRGSKLIEDPRSLLCIRGSKTNLTMKNVLKNIHILKQPNSTMYQRKNLDIFPFENLSKLEWYCQKSDSSMFAYVTNTKKRPNNLILARLHNYQLLDMFEFSVEKFKSFDEFKTMKFVYGNKPCLIFQGEAFDTDNNYKRLKCFFLDFFRGQTSINELDLNGLDHVLTFTVNTTKTIYIRVYRIQLKKSGHRIPRIELEEIGPSFDLSMKRSNLASDDYYKRTLKKPKGMKEKKVKNTTMDVFGTKMGRIHMEKQDFNQLQTRKLKALKRPHARVTATDDENVSSKRRKSNEQKE
ncbi:unnamed protein product [Didymodactylos carnosus]|uniref:Ribosome production factor 2 homolog n=1 Tax=Didymodactylos carnosus TaxID=1234261 RepID=A0A814KP85_9BILA|nr:unnamed protein product [Didymodactylos carnosus]CAF1454510.1 unnamed protein product [Didymodactylos carnosus]CAF3823230.1 unnamed protein product [Didymodactylos carnosus]CAF4248670.1 unnamed protein product [Didymodactylos carnosus]